MLRIIENLKMYFNNMSKIDKDFCMVRLVTYNDLDLEIKSMKNAIEKIRYNDEEDIEYREYYKYYSLRDMNGNSGYSYRMLHDCNYTVSNRTSF